GFWGLRRFEATARWPFLSSRRDAGRETLRLLLALFPPLPFLGGDGEEKVVVKPSLKVCRFPKRSLHPESEAKRYRLAGYVGGGAADFDPVDRPLFDQVIDQGGGRPAHDSLPHEFFSQPVSDFRHPVPGVDPLNGDGPC